MAAPGRQDRQVIAVARQFSYGQTCTFTKRMLMPNSHRQTRHVVSGGLNWVGPTSAFCVGVCPAVALRRPTHPDTVRIQNAPVWRSRRLNSHRHSYDKTVVYVVCVECRAVFKGGWLLVPQNAEKKIFWQCKKARPAKCQRWRTLCLHYCDVMQEKPSRVYKMQESAWAAGAPPRTPLGEFTALTQAP